MDIKNEDENFLKKVFSYFKKDIKRDEEKCNFLNNNNTKNDESNLVKNRTLNFMISSTIILCVLHPLDTIRTRKQIYKVYKNSYPYYYNNKYNLFYILKNEKLESVYRGLVASLITTAISHGIFRFIYDTLNYYFFEKINKINYKNKSENYILRNLSNSESNKSKCSHTTFSPDSSEVDIEKYKKKSDISKNYNFMKINDIRKNENFMNTNLEGKMQTNENNDTLNKFNEAKDKKNVNYYIITSSISSIISVFFLHPVWLVKTKIESTINLNYKFLNYKSRLLSKHYSAFIPRKKIISYKLSNILKLFMYDRKYRKKNINYKKFSLNNKMLESYKNNFIYKKNTTRKKYNYLSYKNVKNPFLNGDVKRKMIHNYLLYKYYTLSILERKEVTRNIMSHFRKKFYKRYILYSKNPISNNKILHIFKREENKNAVTAVYRYKNYFQFVYEIYKKEKLSSFYKGFLASILLTPHVAIQFYIYEYLTHYFNSDYIKNLLRDNNINTSSNVINKFLPFLFGVFSKYVAIIFTYPLYTIKMRQQVQMKNYGFLKVLISIFKYEGIKSYYTGINMHLLRNCLQNGILFFIFEYLNNANR
ncbi:mitochondrial carrier protein, putative [Plasmodium gallinaceum]|uniref:Mitochondrial carrier protein, putative n=1 Tax=Plasmodium gallinaceum TaxID=5849 RepID=A0A1J1GYM3_PLAGA|nr:mitochondrial carrier protein, putative [Plasmodium gallinaceum]CRG97674.1 mitochondrial carrier protein, putative [Plasmodium gallinaceum]